MSEPSAVDGAVGGGAPGLCGSAAERDVLGRERPCSHCALQVHASGSFSSGRDFELPGHGTVIAPLGSVGCRAPSPPVMGLLPWPPRGSTLTPTLHVGALGLLSNVRTVCLWKDNTGKVSVLLCCVLAFSGGATGACPVAARRGQVERQSSVAFTGCEPCFACG